MLSLASLLLGPGAAPRFAFAAETPAESTTVATIRSRTEPGALDGPEAPPTSFFSLDGEIVFSSRYLFQGIDYSEGQAVLQPQFAGNAGGFSAILWLNHDLGEHRPTEFDLSLQYGRSAQALSFTAGIARLQYPNRVDWEPSQEVFADVALDHALSPEMSFHDDLGPGKGLYSTLGISRDVLSGNRSLVLAANLHYQHRYYGLTGIPSVEANAATTLPLGPFGLSPSISRFFSWPNGDFRGESAVPGSWLLSVTLARR